MQIWDADKILGWSIFDVIIWVIDVVCFYRKKYLCKVIHTNAHLIFLLFCSDTSCLHELKLKQNKIVVIKIYGDNNL